MIFKYFIFVLSTFAIACALDEGFKFVLDAGARRCFFEHFTTLSAPKSIDVFVESGGNLDILLTLSGPMELKQAKSDMFDELLLMSEMINSENMALSETSVYNTQFKPNTDGYYAICLDNRKATFLSKKVQIRIHDVDRAEPIALHLGGEMASNKNEENAEEASVSRVMEGLERLKKGIKQVQVQQEIDAHRLQLHSATNKMAHDRVVISSMVETAFFMAAALFQIFFVRRWFANRPTSASAYSRGGKIVDAV